MLEHIGVRTADKTQLDLFAEASPKSSGYANNLGALRNQAGLIEYPSEELAKRAGASPTSSGDANNLGSLSTLGLVDYASRLSGCDPRGV